MVNTGVPLNRRHVIIGAAASASALGGVSEAAGAGNATTDPNMTNVAFMVDVESAVIDYAGPWEVFQRLKDPTGRRLCHLFAVSTLKGPLKTGGGLQIMPDYTLSLAPRCDIIVLGAQGRQTAESYELKLNWIRERFAAARAILSVCTGALTLAGTGLLKGLRATTHPVAYERFEQEYPEVELVRDARFIDNGRIVCAGGETAGIDGALYLGRKLFGQTAAEGAADYMQYKSKDWLGKGA